MIDFSDPIVVWLVVARWMHFAGLSAVAGGAFFFVYERRVATDLPRTRVRMLRIVRVASVLALVSGLGWLAATIANLTGGFASLVDADSLRVFFVETPFGPIWIIRVALLAALVLVAIVPAAASARLTLSALVAAALLTGQAWLGHAAEAGANPRGVVLVLAYSAHVLAVAAWLGGLPPLASALAERRAQGASGLDVLTRYSAMAMGAVALIFASGIANVALHVDDWRRLVASAYGAVLFTKIALVAAMLGLAALNRLVLMPRLRAEGPANRWLSISLATEMLLATLVFGIAAVLGLTAPPY